MGYMEPFGLEEEAQSSGLPRTLLESAFVVPGSQALSLDGVLIRFRF